MRKWLKENVKEILRAIWDNAYSISFVLLLCCMLKMIIIMLCVITYPVYL